MRRHYPRAQTERRGGAGPVRGLLGGKDPTGRFVQTRPTAPIGADSLLHLSAILEPLLVLRRLLPAFVGLAGADQVHVGAEVLAVFAGLIAGAVGAEAEVVGRQLVEGDF